MLEQICETLKSASEIQIKGNGSNSKFLPNSQAETLDSKLLTGIIQHDVDDQVIEVWAGTSVEEVQEELRKFGLCLPLPSQNSVPEFATYSRGTVGGLLSMNLPHALSALCGGPRDWTLGMTVVRADGTTAKSGSKAVKSVAGYDVHKLFIGSRGQMGLIAKVNLRTFPLKALPDHSLKISNDQNSPNYISRTLMSSFDDAVQSTTGLIASDPASCTIWSSEMPMTTKEGWIIGPDGLRFRTDQPAKFETKARDIFDPERKFASGWKE